MKLFVCLAVCVLFASIAMATPVVLTDSQLSTIAAGEVDLGEQELPVAGDDNVTNAGIVAGADNGATATSTDNSVETDVDDSGNNGSNSGWIADRGGENEIDQSTDNSDNSTDVDVEVQDVLIAGEAENGNNDGNLAVAEEGGDAEIDNSIEDSLNTSDASGNAGNQAIADRGGEAEIDNSTDNSTDNSIEDSIIVSGMADAAAVNLVVTDDDVVAGSNILAIVASGGDGATVGNVTASLEDVGINQINAAESIVLGLNVNDVQVNVNSVLDSNFQSPNGITDSPNAIGGVIVP